VNGHVIWKPWQRTTAHASAQGYSLMPITIISSTHLMLVERLAKSTVRRINSEYMSWNLQPICSSHEVLRGFILILRIVECKKAYIKNVRSSNVTCINNG